MRVNNINEDVDCLYYRIYTSFTLEATLATAFGRQVDIQRGELDKFSKAMESVLSGLVDGQMERFILLNSEFTVF